MCVEGCIRSLDRRCSVNSVATVLEALESRVYCAVCERCPPRSLPTPEPSFLVMSQSHYVPHRPQAGIEPPTTVPEAGRAIDNIGTVLKRQHQNQQRAQTTLRALESTVSQLCNTVNDLQASMGEHRRVMGRLRLELEEQRRLLMQSNDSVARRVKSEPRARCPVDERGLDRSMKND